MRPIFNPQKFNLIKGIKNFNNILHQELSTKKPDFPKNKFFKHFIFNRQLFDIKTRRKSAPIVLNKKYNNIITNNLLNSRRKWKSMGHLQLDSTIISI